MFSGELSTQCSPSLGSWAMDARLGGTFALSRSVEYSITLTDDTPVLLPFADLTSVSFMELFSRGGTVTLIENNQDSTIISPLLVSHRPGSPLLAGTVEIRGEPDKQITVSVFLGEALT